MRGWGGAGQRTLSRDRQQRFMLRETDGDRSVMGTEAALLTQHVLPQSWVACWFFVFIGVNRLPGGRIWTGHELGSEWGRRPVHLGQKLPGEVGEPGLGAGPQVPSAEGPALGSSMFSPCVCAGSLELFQVDGFISIV